MFERMEEMAYELCGEVGEEWEAYDRKNYKELNELSEKLNEVVTAWLKEKGNYPSFYAINGIREYNIRACNHTEDCKTCGFCEAEAIV